MRQRKKNQRPRNLSNTLGPRLLLGGLFFALASGLEASGRQPVGGMLGMGPDSLQWAAQLAESFLDQDEDPDEESEEEAESEGEEISSQEESPGGVSYSACAPEHLETASELGDESSESSLYQVWEGVITRLKKLREEGQLDSPSWLGALKRMDYGSQMRSVLAQKGFEWSNYGVQAPSGLTQTPTRFYAIGQTGGKSTLLNGFICRNPDLFRLSRSNSAIQPTPSAGADPDWEQRGILHTFPQGDCRRIQLKDKKVGFVFLGHPTGYGPYGIRDTRFLIEMKKQYPQHVFLLAGPQDILRLRLIQDFAQANLNKDLRSHLQSLDLPFEKAKKALEEADAALRYQDAQGRGLGETPSALPKLKWLLEHVLKTPNFLDWTRIELAQITGSPISEEQGYDFILEGHHDADGLYAQFLQLADLIHFEESVGTLFATGCISSHNLFSHPEAWMHQATDPAIQKVDLESLITWVSVLNKWYHSHVEAALQGYRIESLLAYAEPLNTEYRSPATGQAPENYYSILAADYGQDLNNPVLGRRLRPENPQDQGLFSGVIKYKHIKMLLDYACYRLVTSNAFYAEGPLVLRHPRRNFELVCLPNFIRNPHFEENPSAPLESDWDMCVVIGQTPLHGQVTFSDSQERCLSGTTYAQGVYKGPEGKKCAVSFFSEDPFMGRQFGPYATVLGKNEHNEYVLLMRRGNGLKYFLLSSVVLKAWLENKKLFYQHLARDEAESASQEPILPLMRIKH